MLRLKPLQITANGPDDYRAKCLFENNEVEYKFTITHSSLGANSRNLEHEDAFYFVTFDDPAAEWLERAIQYFDLAAHHGVLIEKRKVFPFKIVVTPSHSSSAADYEVSLQDGDVVEHRIFQIREIDGRRNVTWDYGSCEAILTDGFWKATEADEILKTVLQLHQAIHPKYSLV